jgi:hypothetical protein
MEHMNYDYSQRWTNIEAEHNKSLYYTSIISLEEWGGINIIMQEPGNLPGPTSTPLSCLAKPVHLDLQGRLLYWYSMP